MSKDNDRIIKLLKSLRRNGRITWQQYSTYKGQVLSGNIDGCIKGLERKKMI